MHACMEWNACKTVVRPKHMRTELGMCNCMEYAQVLQYSSTVHALCTEHTDHTHACQQHCMDLNLQQYGIETTLQAWNENGCMEWN